MTAPAADLPAALVTAARAAADDERAGHAAKRCLLDWAGCALGGARGDVAEFMDVLATTMGDADQCTVVGSGRRAAPFEAALRNGTVSHYLDFDDVSVALSGHPGVVVIPAVLALAESHQLGGAATLRAVVAGYEAAAVLGSAVKPSHYDRGWHATGTLGGIAAAVGASVLLGLPDEQVVSAVGLAATQASGVRGAFGSHGKALHAGRAASTGLLSAVLAGHGMRVPPDLLAGTNGYLWLVADDVDLAAADRSGTGVPAITMAALKPHASCGGTHSAIDAVATLMSEHEIDPENIEQIELWVHPMAVMAAGIERPTTGLQAKFSLGHTSALAAFRYPLGVDAFDDRAVADPAVVALRERVTVRVDYNMRYEEHLAMPAVVRITTTAGQDHHIRVDAPRGRAANPMSDHEVELKFVALAAPSLGDDAARAVASAVWRFDEAPEVGHVVRQLAVGQEGGPS